jgi:hypothetical protein
MNKLLQAPIIFFAISASFGCTLYPEVNIDPAKNNKAAFKKDAMDCAQSYPDSGSGVHIKQRISCMNLKGWH